MTHIEIDGNADAEEIAAVVAAIEAVWPRPVAPVATPPDDGNWRWSGRWWRAPPRRWPVFPTGPR